MENGWVKFQLPVLQLDNICTVRTAVYAYLLYLSNITSLYTSYSTVLMVVATVSIVTQPVELFSHRLDESIQSIIQATLMNPNFPGVITASTQGASFRGEKVIGSKFICPNRVIFCCLLTQVSKIELQTSGRNFDVGTSNFNAIT